MYDYQKAVDKAVSDKDTKIEKIADRFRKEVLIPVCKKYGWEFISGMGDFFFSTTDEEDQTYYGDAEVATAAISTSLMDYKLGDKTEDETDFYWIFEVLSTETGYSQCLGYFVNDVRVEDYKKESA